MLKMDDRFWSSGEFWEWDDKFDGPSIDIDEFLNIIDETTDTSQNISAAVSIGQVSCDDPVYDVASQENFQHPSRTANQVSNCADNFEFNYFNNQGITSDVDLGKPILSENSMGYLLASKKYPGTSMEISAGDVNISPYYSTFAQTDDICRSSNPPSDRQCCMVGNDYHLAGSYRSSFISNNEDSFPNMKDEKEEFIENASFQVENTSSFVSGVLCSETEGFNHKADHINDTPSVSGVSISNASVDKMVMPKSWIFPPPHGPRKMQTCIKEESSESAAYDKLHCFSADASDGLITQLSSSIQVDLIPEKGSMMQSPGTLPSISTTKHAVTAKVEDNIFVQSREAHAQNMLEESARMTFIIDLERSASGHGLQGAEPSSSCELSDLLRDGSVGETGHSKKIKSNPSNVSPESTQSNSLDNKSLAATDDSDICILEEICQPVQSITNRNCMVTSQHSIINDPRGVGSRRQSAIDERLVFQVALQDLSQQKSETSAPDGLSVPLLRHQRIALSWMVHKEISSLNCIGGILADDQGLGKTVSTIALILKERAPSHRACQIDTKCNELDALNLDEDDDGNCGLDESKQWLASSQFMPLRSPLKTKNAFVQAKGRLSAGTLVVCPTSVLRQWEDELNHKVTRKADLSVLVYHGSNRTKDPCELAKYDVVLTTYSIVSMEVPKQPLVDKDADDKGNAKTDAAFTHSCSIKKRKNRRSDCKIHLNGVEQVNDTFIEPINRPLAKVQWFRVVLDEAQSIKNHRTQVARACWGLRAKRRWCLSGTPIQNAVDDLYSYFRFLKYDPYCAYRTFCETIKVPINRNPAKGYRKLQAVLKMIMLRRTKGSLLDGEPIITLPSKSVELRRVEFSEVERDFYTRLEADSRAQFKEYADAGTVKQNYVNILLMLLRLRQACDHPLLITTFDSSAWKSSVESARKLSHEKQIYLLHCLEASLAICGLCNDPPEDAVVSICGHVFCNQCICEHLTGDGNHCPAQCCKTQLNISTVFSKASLVNSLSDKPVLTDTREFSCSEFVESPERCSGCFDSSKMRATLNVLESLATNPKDEVNSCSENTNPTVVKAGEKAIVFSQWTRMLDLLEARLKDFCIQYRRLDGTMSVAARDKAVKDFNAQAEVSVMIMSLKAASLGLNMVAACRVILMDLWWNPTTEDQAIDRAHRIGQTRPVTVVRLTVKDTVEDRILALQQKKREMVASAFGEDKSGGRQSRLTEDDLKYLFMA